MHWGYLVGLAIGAVLIGLKRRRQEKAREDAYRRGFVDGAANRKPDDVNPRP